MTRISEPCVTESRFTTHLRGCLSECASAGGSAGVAVAPAVADVMGGIGECSGSLVLTATLGRSYAAAAWRTAEKTVRVRLLTEGGDGPALDLALPVEVFADCDDTEARAARILEQCRSASHDWAAATCLTLSQSLADSVVPQLDGGLMILLQTDFPADADIGRHGVQAAATLESLCRLFGLRVDRLRKSRVCARAVEPLTGVQNLRTPMTALCGPSAGSLLQLRLHPKALCDTLELPPGLIIVIARTRLARPVTRQRLIDAHRCAEMGLRMIAALQRQDGRPPEATGGRLSAITPAEYVERYRDRLPSKITGRSFQEQFGTLRGLNGELEPRTVYKIRSRSEHHIYENRRVHAFATNLVRARRNNDWNALVSAGELMYASHWSHSQRCGIGGLEADRLVTCVRERGPAAGLFGAKVTAGGSGGELVVLMRSDEKARSALAEVVAASEAASNQSVQTLDGSLPGAEFYRPPAAGELADASSAS